MENDIRVLIVDDSALMREVLGDILDNAPGISVVGKAFNGREALAKIAELKPDIVTLDVQMPGMDGLETLDAILAVQPIPVIMVSALTQRAADITLLALDRGALDYVPKPENIRATTSSFRDELIHKVCAFARADVARVLKIRRQRPAKKVAPPIVQADSAHDSYPDCCIAIGISTGGPPVLSDLFQTLTLPLPPIVVVQHMPRDFTGPFARRLDSISRLAIKEAETGDVLQPNHAYIAPGGRHLHLRQVPEGVIVEICDEEPVSGHRPSVDVMMRDVAAAFGSRCLGIIMTGMGHDGVAGCAAIRASGGYVLGQDAATSDVYGMNRAAFVNGAVDRQFAVSELPHLIARQCAKLFPPKRTARVALA